MTKLPNFMPQNVQSRYEADLWTKSNHLLQIRNTQCSLRMTALFPAWIWAEK